MNAPLAHAQQATIERLDPREPVPEHRAAHAIATHSRYQGMNDYSLAAYLEDMQERAEIEQLRRMIRTNGRLTASELY